MLSAIVRGGWISAIPLVRWSTHIGGKRILVGHGGVAHAERVVVFIVGIYLLFDGWRCHVLASVPVLRWW